MQPAAERLGTVVRSWAVPAVLLTVLLRVRFLTTPITSDEGGYFAIGRAWGRGAVLYQDVWVDRPQVLLGLFRLLDTLGLGSPVGVRLLAVVAAVVVAVSCGVAAGELLGPAARRPTSIVVAMAVGVPQLEGFIANGELLAGAFSTTAIALGLRAVWRRPDPDIRLLGLAGVIAGTGMMVKQNAWEAVVTLGALVLVCIVRRIRRGEAWRSLAAALVGGTAIPVAVCAAHGAVTGWDRWFDAVIGYRSSQRSAFSNAEFFRLDDTFLLAAPVVIPGLVVVAVVAAGARRRGTLDLGIVGVLCVWTLAATAAFFSGGQFFRHYWIMVLIPLATAVGMCVASIGARSVRRWTWVVVLAGPVAMWCVGVATPRGEIGESLHGDWRLPVDEAAADWLDDRAEPEDVVYALCASAGLYANVDSDPPHPYLWFDSVQDRPGSLDRLYETLSAQDRPRFVVAYQQANFCDATGRLLEVLRTGYRSVDVVGGRRIYERRP